MSEMLQLVVTFLSGRLMCQRQSSLFVPLTCVTRSQPYRTLLHIEVGTELARVLNRCKSNKHKVRRLRSGYSGREQNRDLPGLSLREVGVNT